MTTRETHLESYALDQYEVLEYVATGGFAEVYRGRDLRSGDEVALKVLKPSQAQKPDAVRRFQEEALYTSLFHQPHRHPHIIEVRGRGECNGYHYIAMPFLRGETLEQRIKRGPLPADEVARVVGAVANALDHAHVGHRRVHRDVKPSNVFLTADGAVVLMDFGLVREQKGLDITATQTIIGTPQYMSPEQIKGQGISFKSDTYALAHVAYEALSGKPAFPNTGDQFGVMWAQVNDQPPPLGILGLAADRAAAAKAVVHHALAKDPAERYETAGHFAAALTDAVHYGRFTPPKPKSAVGAAPPPKGGTGGTKRGAPVGAMLLGAGAFIVLMIMGLLAFRNGNVDDTESDESTGDRPVVLVVDTAEPGPTIESPADEPPTEVQPPEPTEAPPLPVVTTEVEVEGSAGGGAVLVSGVMVSDSTVMVEAIQSSPCIDGIEMNVSQHARQLAIASADGACRLTASFFTERGGPALVSLSNPSAGTTAKLTVRATGFSTLR